VFVGRKGGLTAKQCLNAYSLAEITNLFANRISNI